MNLTVLCLPYVVRRIKQGEIITTSSSISQGQFVLYIHSQERKGESNKACLKRKEQSKRKSIINYLTIEAVEK